jgi:signal transduction histidine kinase
MEKFSILYVDDEDINLRIFKNTFRREYNVFTASNATSGLEILEKEKIDLILSDQRMPEISGVEFLKMTLERHPKPNRILITAYTDFEALQKAINEARIFQYVQKPWNEDYLKEVIKNALELYLLKKENLKLNHQLLLKNNQLENLNEELLELDKLKSDFLSIISHEIRTPLNSLIAPFQLLKEEVSNSTSENIKTYIKILDNSVTRLEKFALNAERITRLKAKRYKLNIEAIVVNKTVENLLTLFQKDIERKKIKVNLDLPDNFYVKADFKLFEFCIEKLIENALKYTKTNEKIEITAYEEGNYKIISVQDEGSGFSKKSLENLFQIFSVVEHTDKNIGIDLALVNLIMETHEGKIIAENNETGALVKLFFSNNFPK